MRLKENELLRERYELSIERIESIFYENAVKAPFADYFHKVACFLLQMKELLEKRQTGKLEQLSFEEYQTYNKTLYQDILPESYEESYANPTYAVAMLGEEFGQLLSFVYTELRAMIEDIYEGNWQEMVSSCELFIELYNLFEEEAKKEEVFHAIYWYLSDYTDIICAKRIVGSCDPSLDFAIKIVMERDLNDLRYLFAYGEYITDVEIQMAEFLNRLPEEEIEKIASTYVDGYARGFVLTGRDLSKKKTVRICYQIGFERIVRKAIEKFEKIGLKPVMQRYALHSVVKQRNMRKCYTVTPANRQYDYDHSQDEGLYFDKAFYERKMAVYQVTCEKNAQLLRDYAGPALIDTFGEEPFVPENKPERVKLSKKQQKLILDFNNEYGQFLQKYTPSEEISFTIIAFPTPKIGEHFEEIFKETVKINTLDYEIYKNVQQSLIDTLDQSEYVKIIGTNGNKTNLTIALTELFDKEKETKFENCLADVNIPLGEVFTSPRLEGTEGILHVKEVFLNGFRYVDLSVNFKEGCISSYTCKNFDSEEENQAYFRDNVMQGHEMLPMGEFAIGTNTTAYAMAKKFDIVNLLPILIVEKMGPHFAVGDTCYKRSEDVRVYNPDGKEIIAKENTFSKLRNIDVSKAYFNCHTDITIPYDEIGEIACYSSDGTKTVIIKDGRFVLAGTEILNKAL